MPINNTHYQMIIIYAITIMFFVASDKKAHKNIFLILGLLGQILLVSLTLDIYHSRLMWTSYHLYALMYVLFVLSNSCLDIYIYLSNKHNFEGFIHTYIPSMFIDFLYTNISTVSTIGCGDITPATTTTRLLYSYKMVFAIFMIVFLLTYISSSSIGRIRPNTVKPLVER